MIDTPIPEHVGRYRIEGTLGRGGMATVYSGVAPDGTFAAVKVLHPHRTTADAIERFEREGKIVIDHPNVVRILDAGRDERGEPYIALERLSGESLAERLTRGPLSPREVRDLGIQVAKGLAAAHRLGLVHRDMKPSNLFLCDDGTVKILDFGVALERRADKRVTASSGKLLGTLQYTSPEQAQGARDLDRRSDLWSVGVVLFEALSGARPFVRDGQVATVLAIVLDSPPPLAAIAPHAPMALCHTIERCLVKSRDHRTPSAETLTEELEAILDAGTTTSGTRRLSTYVTTHPEREVPLGPPLRSAERRVVAIVLVDGVADGVALASRARRDRATYVPVLGDRAIVLFGTQGWEGDELSRATMFALECRDDGACVSLSAGFAVRSGAHVEGEAVSSAEANLEVAREGEVVVDASLAPLLQGARLGALRGAAYVLLELGAHGPEAVPMLLGRDPELTQVSAAAEVARDDACTVVVRVLGSIGSGKSRFLSESAARVNDRFPVLELVHGAREADRARVDSVAAMEGPVALFVDDAHSMEVALLDALEDLVLARASAPTLVVMAMRDDSVPERLRELRGRDTTDVQLRGLSAAEVGKLASAVAGFEIPTEAAVALRARTDGNPFFVMRIASLAARKLAEGSPGSPEEALEAALPLDVVAAVQARLDRLAAGDRELCMIASIAGLSFTETDLEALSGADVPRRVASLVRAGVLVVRSRRGHLREYAFRSSLTRGVAGAMLTDERRQALLAMRNRK